MCGAIPDGLPGKAQIAQKDSRRCTGGRGKESLGTVADLESIDSTTACLWNSVEFHGFRWKQRICKFSIEFLRRGIYA